MVLPSNTVRTHRKLLRVPHRNGRRSCRFGRAEFYHLGSTRQVPRVPEAHLAQPNVKRVRTRPEKKNKKSVEHGSLNVPIEHHPTIRYMVYNGYYKVMSMWKLMGKKTIKNQGLKTWKLKGKNHKNHRKDMENPRTHPELAWWLHEGCGIGGQRLCQRIPTFSPPTELSWFLSPSSLSWLSGR